MTGRPAGTATDILDRWGDLVDPRTGIVQDVSELRLDDDQPAFVHYLSTAAATQAWGLLPNFGNNGGVGADRMTALRKALGEAVERYCSAIFDYDDLVWGSHRQLAGQGRGEPLDPDRFALYSPKQLAEPGFPWAGFGRDTPTAWVPGTDLGAATVGWPGSVAVPPEPAVLVPAAFVYVPYHYLPGRPDTPITQPISTGLACGGTRAAAELSPVCEAVERDAFTITWQRGLSRPRWDPAGLPVELRQLLGRYERVGLRVHVVDITTDVAVPTVMTIAEGLRDTSPALAVAAATHPDPLLACRRSLEELAHTRRFSSQVMEYLPAVPVDVPGGHPEVTSQREHLRLYCGQEAKPYAAFLWSGPQLGWSQSPAAAAGRALREATNRRGLAVDGRLDTDRGDTARAQLGAVVEAVTAAGEQVALVDLTTADVAQLSLHVVRVVVPGLHPLQMGHRNRARGGRRLREVPARIGSEPAFDDNPYPHPFP